MLGDGVPQSDVGAAVAHAQFGEQTCYVLLVHNTCVVSIFGFASVIEYCAECEPFARSADDALLYVFDPGNQSHRRHLLAEYLSNMSAGRHDPAVHRTLRDKAAQNR